MAILSRENPAFKWLSLLTVVFELPFCAITMGWAPLQYILRNEQYFVPEGCEQNLNGTVSMIDSNHTKFKVCNDDQEQTFMMVYLIGDFMNYFCGFFVGMILDNFGTRIFRLIAQLGFGFAFLLGYLARPQKN